MNKQIERVLNAKYCGDLFVNNKESAKQEYHNLVKAIHPDICSHPHAEIAMEKLNGLYGRAEECFSLMIWEQSNIVWLIDKSGKRILVKYLCCNDFELGKRYVCNESIVYVLNPIAKKYYDNYLKSVKALRYANDKMKTEMSRFMPSITMNFECSDGMYVLVVKKPKDMLPMDLLISSLDNTIDVRHMAWMISRLNNITCFLSYNKLSHNGITLSNCFVSPKYHSISLLGGWWYASPFCNKMIGTTKEVYDNMPVIEKTEKTGSPVTDLESVKAIGRIIKKKFSLPKAINRWIGSGSSKSAYQEYEKWSKALESAYGARKFVPFDINIEKFYENIEM